MDIHLFSFLADFGDDVALNAQTRCDVPLTDSETFKSQDLSVVGHDRSSLYCICTGNVRDKSIGRFPVVAQIRLESWRNFKRNGGSQCPDRWLKIARNLHRYIHNAHLWYSDASLGHLERQNAITGELPFQVILRGGTRKHTITAGQAKSTISYLGLQSAQPAAHSVTRHLDPLSKGLHSYP